MKKGILLVSGIFLLSSLLIAQTDKYKIENDKKYFDESDKDFDLSEVPEKWKSESAVILCQKLSFSYTTRDQLSIDNYYVEETVRKKIKLIDKAAVEEFSKFYFLSSAKVGIRIIKPNGTVKDVDLSEAIDEESKIPDIYRAFAVFETYKKLAIPGLEPGDIMDYYYSTISITQGRDGDTKAFRPFIFTLNASYPIVQQTVFYNVDRNYFINFNSTNGAPSLVEGDAGSNYNGDVKENIKTYILKDKDRNKIADERWLYEYRNYPTIKFQVVSGSKNAFKDSEYFLGVRGEPKMDVKMEEMVLSMSRRFLNETVTEKYFKSYTVPFIVDYIKNKHKGVTDAKILMTEAYYCFRFHYPNVIGGYVFILADAKSEYLSNDSRIPDELFCEVMIAVAKKLKIKLEVFIAIPRSIGTFEKVLLPGELNIGVRVDNSLLLSPPRFYSVHTTLDPEVEGCKAIVFIPEDDAEKLSYNEIELSESGVNDNLIRYNVSASVDDNFELIKTKRTTGYKGNYIENAPVYLCYDEEMFLEDRRIYDVDFKEKAEDKMTKNQLEEKAKKDEEQAEYFKKVMEYLKENTEGDFEIQDYNGFKVLNTGRTADNNEFLYEEDFTIKNMLNKAGRNYSLNVGLLLGEQVELSEKERIRENSIDMAYPKSIHTTIKFTVPDGYTLEGIEDLNMNIDNPSMSFISKASMDGKDLNIEILKVYKVNHDSKDNWKNWIEAIDAAYNFTQKKIVMKKSN